MEAPDSDPVGPYSSLGINAFELGDRYESPVDTIALYDISKLKNASDYVELTFSLSKRSNYASKLPIDSYLTGVTIYGADGEDEDTEDDVIFLQTNAPITTGNDLRTKKETDVYTVRIKKTLLNTLPGGNFVIPIKFNVITGDSEFNNDGLQYSNYKVTITAQMFTTIGGDDSSSASYAKDHIIYTNARVISTVVE